MLDRESAGLPAPGKGIGTDEAASISGMKYWFYPN